MSTKATKCPECGKPYIHFDVHWSICEKNPNKDSVSEPTMSTNIDTTEGLDEAYYQYLGGTPDDDEMESWEEFKQAILDWVNEVVIGEDSNPDEYDEGYITPGDLEDIEMNAENKKNTRQREILKAHGWKESK